MKESELRQGLKRLYPDITPAAHNSLMQAVPGKEQTVMKRKLGLTTVLALLILLALATVAYAAVSFSVRDMGWQGGEDFEEHIVEINRRYENDYMAVTVNDAGFDGQSFAMALSLENKREGEHVFIRPRLSAECGGVTYDCDVESMRNLDFMSGFVYPDVHHPEYNDGLTGFDGSLLTGDGQTLPSGEITWTLTMKVYHLLYDVEKDDTVFMGGEGELERYAADCREAYRNRRILVQEDGNLATYLAMIQPVTGIDEETYWSFRDGEEIAATGVGELVDTIVCRYTTKFGDEASLTGLMGSSVALDGYSVVLDRVDLSFRTLNVSLHYDLGQPLSREELSERMAGLPVRWNVSTDGGATLLPVSVAGDASVQAEDGSWRYEWYGSYAIPEGQVDAITFIPAYQWNEAEQSAPAQGVFIINVHGQTVSLLPQNE